MFCFPKIQHCFQYRDLAYVPAYGKKIPVSLMFVFGSCGEEMYEEAASAKKGTAQEAQNLILWMRCPWSAGSLPHLAPWSIPGCLPSLLSHMLMQAGPQSCLLQRERLAGHTVGVLVESVEIAFSILCCPMGILCSVSALFWFLDGSLVQESWKEAVVQLF